MKKRNKTNLLIVLVVIILIIIAILFIKLIYQNTKNPPPLSNPSNESCTSDSDCVPAQCCHPTSCINSNYKGVCNLLCTNVCSGPIDCNEGFCACVSGKCSVVQNLSTTATD